MKHLLRLLPAALALALLLSACGKLPASSSGSASGSSDSGSASAPVSSSASEPSASSSSQPEPQDPFHAPAAPEVTWEDGVMSFSIGSFTATAETFGEGEGGHNTVLAICSANNPAVPFQTLTTESPEDAFGESCLSVADANFDGYPDLGWMYIQAGVNSWYHWWLWNEEEGQFEEESAFRQASDGSGGICSPAFDPASGTIRGTRRDSATDYETVLYHWEEGKLTLRRQIVLSGEDGAPHLQVLEPADGELTPIHESEGPGAAEEAFLWENLDYNG